MYSVQVIVTAIGMLVGAYALSWPLYFVFEKLTALFDRFQSLSLWLLEMNAMMDEDPDFLPWSKSSK